MPERYRTIVADPPWDYGSDHARWPSHLAGGVKRPSMPYAPMSVADISALPVAGMVDPSGGACFLWTTNRHLPAAFGVLSAWGFEYRQTLLWHKVGCPSPFGGSIAPVHAEFLLLGRTGKVKLGRWSSSVVSAPRAVSHSAKPEVFLDMIEQASPGPYVELFARRARFGWDYWGDQSLGTAVLAEAAE